MCRNNGSAEIAGMDIAGLDKDLTDVFAGVDIAARDVDRVVNDGRILPTTSRQRWPINNTCLLTLNITRMWANAQRDCRPVNIDGALCSRTLQRLADVHY